MRRTIAASYRDHDETEPTLFPRSARRAVPLSILALTTIALLAGCQPTPAGSDDRLPVSASSDPVTAPVAAAPVSLVGTDCAGLLSLAAVQSTLSTDVVLVDPLGSNISTPSGPLVDTAIAQDGGIKCVWRNGDPDVVSEYRGVTLWLLPNADAAWAARADDLNAADDQVDILGGAPIEYGDESITDCGGTEDPWYYGTCFYNLRVGSYWLSIEIDGMLQDSAEHSGRPVLEAATAAVEALPAPAAAWTPPAGSASLASSCEGAVPLATARSAISISTLIAEPTYKSGYEAETAALYDVDALYCVWDTPADWVDPAGETFGVQITLVAIPGAEWAWSGTAAPPHDTEYALAPVTGIGVAAWGGCRSDFDACELQVLSRGTWFSIDSGYTRGSLTPLITIGTALIDSSH